MRNTKPPNTLAQQLAHAGVNRQLRGRFGLSDGSPWPSQDHCNDQKNRKAAEEQLSSSHVARKIKSSFEGVP
jgi:hypothetical protein